MSDQSTSSSSGFGCGPVIAIVFAVFCLLLGIVAGAGGLYSYLAFTDDGLQQAGLAPDVEATVETETEPATPHAFAHPLVETLDLQDALDEEAVRTQIADSRQLLEECYSPRLGENPDLRGEIVFQFSVDGDSGNVVAGVARSNQTGSDELANCVTSRIRDQWSFPAPETSGVSTARFHALFLPLNS